MVPTARTVVPFLVLAMLVCAAHLAGGFESVEHRLMDLRFRLLERPASQSAVVVAIDEPSVAALETWPPSRNDLATVTRNLLDAGATRVALCLDLSLPAEEEDDFALAETLDAAGKRAVLSVFRHRDPGEEDEAAGRIRWTAPLPRFQSRAALARVSVGAGEDGLARTYDLDAGLHGPSHPPLAEVLSGPSTTLPARFYLDHSIDPESLPRVPFADVLSARFDPSEVRERIAIVGVTHPGLGDLVAVPGRDPLPWPVLEAVALESLAGGRILRRVSPLLTAAGAFVLALGFGPLFLRAGHRSGFALLLSASLFLAAVSVAVHALGAWMLDISPWIATLVGTAVLVLALRAIPREGSFLLRADETSGARNLMARLAETSTDAVLTLDAGLHVRNLNRAAREMFGCRSGEASGRTLDSFILPLQEGGEGGLLSSPGQLRAGLCEGIGRARSGASFPVEITIGDLDLDEEMRWFVTVRDISRRKAQEKNLEHRATHDALTGLPNRVLLHERLDRAMAVARREGRQVAFLLLDLDGFKEINDSLGHQVGDQMLERVAERLRTSMHLQGTVARLDGDQFAVLLPDAALGDAVEAGRALEAGLAKPFELRELSLQVEASIGVALFPTHARKAFDLIQCADVAMYSAKNAGRGVAVYRPEDDYGSLRNLTLNGQLRRAIESGELVLYYQPKIGMDSGRVESVEALVRWPHPEHGLLSPDSFIGLAEHSGLIRPLTRWVLGQAVADCVRWQRAGQRLSVAVNVSARNLLEEDLPGVIRDLLHEHGLPPGWLKLEITEGLLVDDPDRALAVITRLDALGVGIAIDDFGTGYSSLAYLKRLPAGEIKIDKSFIRDVDRDSGDAVIVRSTIEMAHDLGQVVVAEGVETEEVWELLRSLGCDYGQGFFFSHPLPPDEFEIWLRASPWGPGQDAVEPVTEAS